ncbi:MAG: TonB-dependent receptor plug domain-containing protein [Gammaproteobacteria bacterium]|nr:TonB-dependent receptor plug domain-containing protein [Gammaproteobacteria bacterium]
MSTPFNLSRALARITRPAVRGSMTALALIAGIGAAVADDAVLGEVLVTAQKRSENVQDVPSSVSVFGGEQLERLNAKSLVDYAAYLPGFNINSGGTPGQTTIVLRGVAPVGPGSVVGTYIDDTPLGSSSNYARATIYALDLLPDDIERVEVLRGPQGTLYGAGAMGGLLKYALRNPDLEQFSARVGGETFDIQGAGDMGWGARASLNAPLVTDKLGVRFSGFTQTTAAYSDNAFTGREDINEVEQTGGRAALLWQATDNFSVKLGGLWQRTKGDNNNYTTLELTGIDPPTGQPTLGEATAFHPLDEPFRKDLDFYSLTLNWDVGGGSFVSATSYSDTQTVSLQDASQIFGSLYSLLTGGLVPDGNNAFTLGLDLEKWTQELRFASVQGERFEWLVGAFYTEEKSGNRQESVAFDVNNAPIAIFAPFFAFAELPTDYQEIALFGDATFKFSAAFDVTVGLRWAENEQEFRQISGGAILPTADVPAVPRKTS